MIKVKRRLAVAILLVLLVPPSLGWAAGPPRCQATIIPASLKVFSAGGSPMGEVSKYLPNGTPRPVGVFGCIAGWYLITPDEPPGTAQIVHKDDLRVEEGCDPCRVKVMLPAVGGQEEVPPLSITITEEPPRPSWQPQPPAAGVLPLADTSGWCPMCGKYVPPKAGVKQFLEVRTICLQSRSGGLVAKTGRVYRESDGAGHWDLFIEVRQGILGLFKAERVYWGDPRIASYRGCSDDFLLEAPWYLPEEGWYTCPKTDPPPPREGCRWVRVGYPDCGWMCLP